MCNSDIFLEIEQPLRLTFTQFWPFIARMQEVFIDCTYFEPHKLCLVFIFCTFYRFSCFPIALDASIGECDQNSFYNFHWPKYVLSPFIIRGEQIIRYSNIIRIIFEYQNICIRIRLIFSNRIIFVFVFGWFFQTE